MLRVICTGKQVERHDIVVTPILDRHVHLHYFIGKRIAYELKISSLQVLLDGYFLLGQHLIASIVTCQPNGVSASLQPAQWQSVFLGVACRNADVPAAVVLSFVIVSTYMQI